MKSFNYQKICLNFLEGLPQRTANVVERRFGLNPLVGGGKRETLEMIGKSHGLTRERVRQIEKDGFFEIRSHIEEHQDISQNFKRILKSFGNFKEEKSFFASLTEEKFQNHIFFLLTIYNDFQRIPESKSLRSFWTIDKNSAVLAKKIIKQTIGYLEKQKEPMALKKFFNLQELGKPVRNFKGEEKLKKKNISNQFFQSSIEISKEIQKSPSGLYGLKNWLEINPRGIKDRAYLVLKEEKTPLHFRRVADLIEKLPFPSLKIIQIATVHNELIKDGRFVLVGRGLYALKEWGYEQGAVKDVIIEILKGSKIPLFKKEILNKVLKKRFVKGNTVLLNLNNKNYFFKDDEGRYKIREA